VGDRSPAGRVVRMTGKRCTHCRRRYKSVAAAFARNRTSPSGFAWWCKRCLRERWKSTAVRRAEALVKKQAVHMPLALAMGQSCTKCRQHYKDVAKHFNQGRTKTGFCCWCKKCLKKHRRTHASKIKKANRRRYRRNRSKILQRNREHRKRVRGVPVQRAAHLATVRAWCAQNRDRVNRYHREDRRRNKARIRAWDKERKARIRGSRGRGLPVKAEDLWVIQGGACYWCDAVFSLVGHQLDHVIPIKLGGGHVFENLVLSCPLCNRRKNNRHPADFSPERWERFKRERGIA
jgi:5-methylcytosine-specific restriction endonuclease McrA